MLRQTLSAVTLAALAGAAPAAEVRHNYHLSNVLWHLSFSMDDGTIAGDATNTVTLAENSPTVQLSCSELDVSQVSVDGQSAKFTNSDGVLTVTLPQPGRSGQTLAIRTVYTGTPVNGFYFVPARRAFPAHTGVVYTQGEGEDNHFWLPTYDKPDDKATTECFITVPAKWTAISNGRLVDVLPTQGGRTFHWKMDQPFSTYLISLVAGEFERGGDAWHGIPVDYYVPPGLEAEGRTSFGETSRMIDLFSKLTGVDYPYAKFAQEAVADFMFGGMENITAVTQTITTLHPASTEPVRDSAPLVAHELAHQWFGDLVTCRTWDHVWLNKGFASTLPAFWDRDGHRDHDAFDFDRFHDDEGAIDSIGSRGRKEVPGAIGSMSAVHIGSVYSGGAARILLLMHEFGEAEIWRGIHTYLEAFKFKPATTDDFFITVGKTIGRDLRPFEAQWFHSSSTPSLTVSLAGTNLAVTQLAPYYTFNLPVWLLSTPVQSTLFSAPVWERKMLHVSGPTSTLALTAEEAKMPLLADPEAWIPAEIHYGIGYKPDQVAQLYHHAPNVAERGRIIIQLFDALPPADRLAIAQSERFPQLLELLSHHFGQEGAPYLVAMTHHGDKSVVHAGLAALAALKPDPPTTARVQELAEKDPNEAVRERAMETLLAWTKDIKVAQRAFGLRAFDDGFRVMAVQWFGDHAPDVARATSLQILANPDSEPLRVAALQVLGKVKDRPGEHEVFDALCLVAKETSFGARRAAIVSLGQLGNPAAIPLLEKIGTHAPAGIRGAVTTALLILNLHG